MKKKLIGIFFVVLFVTHTLCASAVSNASINDYDERPSSKSFHFYRAFIIGIVSNYDEDDEDIHFKILGLGLSVEIYEGNPYPPIAIGIINEEGTWKKPINDYFRGILTRHFICGVYRV
ncbi:MAG: hypothetical protein JSW06_03655 [Thermoplasmatales archaeon]|nr:MAG: hypothetical protein JSW06_03655 [Thermoplasmatales archaeon]